MPPPTGLPAQPALQNIDVEGIAVLLVLGLLAALTHPVVRQRLLKARTHA
jgi:hypothetical protein